MQTHIRTPKFFTLLIALSAVLLAGALWMVFAYAPEEQTMGIVQKIFYFHVSSAWVGFFAFFVTFLGSLLYLLRGQDRWDQLAAASAEIGFVFISITLVSGMLWAKPVWGAYWVWEMRLTISLIQWLMYFLLHAAAPLAGPIRTGRACQRGVRQRGLRDRAAVLVRHPLVAHHPPAALQRLLQRPARQYVDYPVGLFGSFYRAVLHLPAAAPAPGKIGAPTPGIFK